MTQVTNRERFCRLYDFEEVDRPTRWEAVVFWPQALSQWRAEGGLAEDEDVMERYAFDPRPVVSGGLGATSMDLSGDPVQSRVVKDEGNTQVLENDLGKVWRVRCDGHESMPHWLRFPVESHQDWLNKIKPRLDPSSHSYGELDEEAEELRGSEDPIGLFIVGLYAFWRNFWGMENLSYAFYETPDTLHDMADAWRTMHCSCLRRVFDTMHIDYVMFHEDMAFKNGPLIGPNLFDQFMTPYYQDVMAELRTLGQHRFILDSDGHNGAVLDRFIELGVNGLFPFEVAAGYDIRQIRKMYPRFFIWGGLDKRVLLEDRDAIEREVAEKVPAVWESGGFIPAVDHAVPPCPQENFEFLLERTRSFVE